MTDHICQLRESSHTYLYISLSMSTNVWSSLACETMCGRGHEYYVRGNPFVYTYVLYMYVRYGTRFGFVARAEPYDRWVELEVLFKLQKKSSCRPRSRISTAVLLRSGPRLRRSPPRPRLLFSTRRRQVFCQILYM